MPNPRANVKRKSDQRSSAERKGSAKSKEPVRAPTKHDPTIEPTTKQDLILRRAGRCTEITPFDIRWKFTPDDDEIDPSLVQDWNDRLLGASSLNLKRIKIVQLERKRLILFLSIIGNNLNNSLERLEIDTLELAHPIELRGRFHFPHLRSLAIDEVVVVNEQTGKALEPVPEPRTWVTFFTTKLEALQLGEYSAEQTLVRHLSESI